MPKVTTGTAPSCHQRRNSDVVTVQEGGKSLLRCMVTVEFLIGRAAAAAASSVCTVVLLVC